MQRLFAFICFLFILLLLPAVVLADNLTPSPSDVVTLPPVIATPTVTEVNYTLPYPGILPNNPLYWLKISRDNVIGWLIAGSVKKAEFDILQADKRLESGVFLINDSKDNAVLALSTISKGENYMTDAISKAQQAKSERTGINDLVAHLHNATQKHVEVLNKLIVPAGEQKELTQLQKRAEDLVEQAATLSTKK